MKNSSLVVCLVAGLVALVGCGSNPEVVTNDPNEPLAGRSHSGGTKNTGGDAPIDVPRGGSAGSSSGGRAGSGGHEVYCGDGELASGETCDDGNSKPGDGCSGTCKLEPGYRCETPGKPCVSTAACGDGVISNNEICDDGNGEDGDGCSDACEVEPGYTCVDPGKPCEPVAMAECGNGGVEFGETCDDGDDDDDDGCDAKCRVEPGYRCPMPGSPCVPEPKCGDGLRSPGEQCDDGGTDEGDGCDAACRMEGPYWDCSKPGVPCVSLLDCGDGKALGDAEECDDGDNDEGDGCSAACTTEPGWICPPGGGTCWIRCGDGEVAGTEQCDDSGNDAGDGCSPICQLEIGFRCAGSPSQCTRTTCGDGKKEGLEQCDDGNVSPFDGCSPICMNEPECLDANGNRTACAAVCGDGLKFPTEDCDDGNTRSGDGCSEDCAVESGYVCDASEIPDRIELPTVYRDFTPGAPSGTGHTDFQWNTNLQNTPNPANLWYTSDNNGGYRDDNASSPNLPNRIRLNVNGTYYNFDQPEVVNSPLTRFVRTALGNNADAAAGASLLGKPVFTTTCPLSLNGTGQSFLRRNEVYYCANTVQGAGSFATWFTGSVFSVAVPSTLTLLRCPGGSVCTAGDADTFLFDSDRVLPDGTPCTGTECGFFPLDDLPNVTKYPACGTSSGQHNFHFTSEVRYWFQYDSTQPATLTFTGDDDVFVFVNGRLVVDIGGVHQKREGSVTLNANTRDSSNTLLGLTQGAIYEIIVFQAERNTCQSNYRLQLKNFVLGRSTCSPRCGDGVVTPDEACDRGAENVAPGADTYGRCTTQCELGPRCGDGSVQAAEGEECDNGLNNDLYQTSEFACASGCVVPPRCGDGNLDAIGGELCDEGSKNADDGYGPDVCTLECQPAPYCGDRSVDVDFGEVCDDGVNSGMPGSCKPDCTGTVDLPSCGNGRQDPGEECDDGQDNGTRGSACDTRCRLRCGNGFKDPGEECDDGINDGTYGGCNADCTPAGYCGDGVMNGPEQCDLGDDNGAEPYGEDQCTVTCRSAPYCGDGRIQTDFDEECDSTPGCGNDCARVIPR